MRREHFLGEIDLAAPRDKLHKLIEPHCPKTTGTDRPPIVSARTLRIRAAQQYFRLSNEGTENAIYDSKARRAYVCTYLYCENAPDAPIFG